MGRLTEEKAEYDNHLIGRQPQESMGRKQRYLYKSVRADCNISPNLTRQAPTAQHAASIKNLSECFQETGAEEMGDKTALTLAQLPRQHASCR